MKIAATAVLSTALAAAVILPVLLAGCSSIEWTDFIKLNDITYYSDLRNDPLDESTLSPYGEIKHNVQGISNPGYKIKNGDAAFLEEGTSVYSIRDYAPTFRLAAMREQKWFIYEADNSPNATKGSDLLDIGGKVQYIGINSTVDGAELSSIKEPAQVDGLVRMVLEAPVDQDSENRGSEQYFLEFHLKDGTSSTRSF